MKKNLLIILLVICILSGCSSVRGNEDTNYFFPQGTSLWMYEGRFLESSLQTGQIELSVIEVKDFEEGNLYELVWNCNEAVPDRYGGDRRYLGLFLVLSDSIYLFRDEYVKEELPTVEEIKNSGTLVCSKYGKEDSLGEDEGGWHEYILVEDNRSEYHGYNNLVETGYYECFVWEIGKGLIAYRSGYGAEADAIEVYLTEQ